MARTEVLTAAVRSALSSAVADEEGVRFDPAELGAALSHCTSGAARDAVLALVDAELARAVEDLDSGRVQAAVTLRARVEAGTTRREVKVENLNGDVGGGSLP